MKTPLRYAGGKSKVYDTITMYLPFFLERPDKIISPFLGGGGLESRWSTELGIEIEAFDIFEVLVNFWQVLLEDAEGLANLLDALEPDQATFSMIKEELMCWGKTQDMLKGWHTSHYERTPKEMDRLTGAAYYFFNHNLSYGPMYLGHLSSVYEDKEKWANMVNRIRAYKNPRMKVRCASFEDVIPSYPNDFLYLDPPYYLDKDGDNKMFKGIYPNGNIDVHHSGFDHEKLRDLLHSHKGRFIMSYNNCETIREYYRDFRLEYPSWHYSYGLGETRVGKNKIDNTPKESHEILIIKE